MKIILIFLGQLKWHYGRGLKSLFSIWKNFFAFIINLFSIKYLFQNFFDTWKRMSDPYPKKFSFQQYLFTFLVNLIARIVGMIMRLALLIAGLIACTIFCLILPIAIVSWLALPFIIIGLFICAFYLIIK